MLSTGNSAESRTIRQLLKVDTNVEITSLQTVDSTNDWCRREYAAGRRIPYACVAASQSAGKGRRGRHWQDAGDDVLLSFTRRFDLPLQELGCMALAAGLAVQRCLQLFGIENTELKWPNDVLVAGGKIAGVLIESVQCEANSTVLVIGVGVNVSHKQVPDADVVSLQSLGREGIERERLIAALIDELEKLCRRIVADTEALSAELSALFDDSAEVDILLEDGTRLTGIMQGIDQQGELRVQVEGETRVFNSADISLRKGSAA